MSFKPTNEQGTCVGNYGKKESFKVEAVAGSGKTSTVKLMAESDERKALYLAFNKAAAEEAGMKMPCNVTCRTTHSIAYSAFGATYREKLSRPRGGYVNVAGTVSEMVKYFKIKNTGSLSKNALARLSKLTVAAFESSASDSITERHVPTGELQKMQDKADKFGEFFDYQAANTATVKLAKRLWEARIDLSSPVLITHDTYLKMYQLSKPVLKYDVIFLDEAQDTSDCVIDIVLRQDDHTQIVCVGDSYQAIYGWRGAVNALGKIKTQSTPLSQSFRYGPAVAEVATHILDGAVTVRGFDKLDTKVGKVDRESPYVMLFRTNAALIEVGVDLINEGESVNIDIDTRGYVKQLEAMVQLFNEEDSWKIKHEDICVFEDWSDLLEEVELVKGELGRMAKSIESGEYRKVLAALSKYQKPRAAHVKLTTAHKSKGMEYAQVILANDFPDVVNEEGKFVELNDMERNLLYVASTRAMLCLELNNTVREIVEQRLATEEVPTDSLNELELDVQAGYLKAGDVIGSNKRTIKQMFGDLVGRETSSDMAIFENMNMEDQL